MKRAWTGLGVALPVLAVLGELRQKVSTGWRPTGDDAIFAIHAHDVFSSKSPLLGTYSVVTQSAGKSASPVYHLGPMVSWVLAIPERMFSDRLGVAIGAGLVNVTMLLAIVFIIRRIATPQLVCVVSVALTITAWSVGRNTLAEPWNPYIGLWSVPLLVVLCIAWASGNDTTWTLPAIVGVASFAVQAHYLFLGPVLAVVAASIAMVRVRPSRRSVKFGILVGIVAWLPTIVQQLLGSPGNLASWFTATRSSTEHTAPFVSFSLRMLVNTIGIVPVALRGPLNTGQLIALGHAPSLLTWLVSVFVLGILILGAARCWRTRRVVAVCAVVALALVAGCALTLSRYPVPLVSFPYYRIVMCWIASTGVWLAGLTCLVSLINVPRWKRIAALLVVRRIEMGLMLPIVVVTALIVMTARSPHEPVDEIGAHATQQLAAQTLRSLQPGDRYVVQGVGARGIFVIYGLFRELLLDGRDVYVRNDEVQLRRDYGIGDRRAATIVVASGSLTAPPGARALAVYDGRTEQQRVRYAYLLAHGINDERFGIEQSEFVVYLIEAPT